jgi:hypothetical protein
MMMEPCNTETLPDFYDVAHEYNDLPFKEIRKILAAFKANKVFFLCANLSLIKKLLPCCTDLMILMVIKKSCK